MHHRQLQETITYSAGEVRVDRPPNPLSIFNVGFDKRLGNEDVQLGTDAWSRYIVIALLYLCIEWFRRCGMGTRTGLQIRLWICSLQWISFLSLR